MVQPASLVPDTVSEVIDTSLTPATIKKISRSVMDLSALPEMKDISKSTSNLMTGNVLTKMKTKKSKEKSESKQSLVSIATSLAEIEGQEDVVRRGEGFLMVEDLIFPGL